MADSVQLDINASGTATITLNRPEVHNAFHEVLVAQLTELLHSIGKNDNVRVVVLAASGKSFSAGADLNWMRRMADYSQQENYKDAMKLATLMQTLDELPKPAIAKIQGPAFRPFEYGMNVSFCFFRSSNNHIFLDFNRGTEEGKLTNV